MAHEEEGIDLSGLSQGRHYRMDEAPQRPVQVLVVVEVAGDPGLLDLVRRQLVSPGA
jgi:hypothetical protein